MSRKSLMLDGESAGIRTQDPRLKRAMLYQLSYRLSQTQRRHIVTRGAGREGSYHRHVMVRYDE